MVQARNGMVATSQPLAAMAGLRMMMQGGNAIDAAVATAAVLNVVEPESTGIGGDMFALVWNASEKKVIALNGSGRAPASASPEELRQKGMSAIPDDSIFSVTVPGAVSGWNALIDRFGRMSLSDVLQPAIEYASEGFPVSEVISGQWAEGAVRLRAQRSGNELLLNGRAPMSGEVMRLPELANSLRTIAEGGAEAFYKGPIAEKIAAFAQAQGGWLTAEDMAAHEATWEEAIFTDYRGVRCWQCPPNNQGVNVLMALNIAEGFDISGMGFQSEDAYHHLIESVRLALTDGLYHVTDPSKMRIDASELISKAYAEKRRKLISQEEAMDTVPVGSPGMKGDTIYLTAVDKDGNACSLINSVYTNFGSGLVAPGTGIALQSRGASFSLDAEHVNVLEPNKRPFHTLIPGMATRDGELWLSYGVMGTVQQAQGQFQVLSNMIDFGLNPQEALDAPRFSFRPYEGLIGLEEERIPESLASNLRGRGHQIFMHQPDPLFFGGGQVIERNPDTGVIRGGSEPRNDGCAIGW